MPIYKIYGKRSAERRNQRLHARMRWAAIALSAVLLGLAVLMLSRMH